MRAEVGGGLLAGKRKKDDALNYTVQSYLTSN